MHLSLSHEVFFLSITLQTCLDLSQAWELQTNLKMVVTAKLSKNKRNYNNWHAFYNLTTMFTRQQKLLKSTLHGTLLVEQNESEHIPKDELK